MNLLIPILATALNCDGNNLMVNGWLIHSFPFSSDCREAAEQLRGSKTGLFCDKAIMHQLDYGYVTSFSWASDCKEAVSAANKHRGHFCRNSVLMNFYGFEIHDYVWKDKCREALAKI